MKARSTWLETPVRRLVMAAQNALEIMRLGRLSAESGAPFDLVYEGMHYRLRHYGPEGGGAGSAPLVLVPPLMVASEVYDIAPDVSAIRALLREGIDVWLVDFGAPEREEGGLERTLDDHVRAVSDAVTRIRERCGRDVHLAGYSQGGMFVYQAAALRRSAGIASVVTFGSPVDLHRSVPTLGDRITESLVGALHAALALPLERVHGLPGKLTSTAFKLLSVEKELSQLADFVRKLHDRQALARRESKRLFLRGEGFVAWPGPALRKFLDELVVANRMRTGGFVIDGNAVSLADIDCPIAYFLGTRDEMARPEAVRGIREAAPRADTHEIAAPVGHFGLVVGGSAQETTWPTVAAWVRWREGQGAAPRALSSVRATASGAKAAPARDEDFESAIEDLEFDVRLAADVVSQAATAGAGWTLDVAESAADALAQVRWQVPRLHRLRRIRPDTRISLAAELSRQAARIGDKTFFLWRGRAFSYEVASRRVDNVARGLIACGVRPGDRVAVVMGARPSFLSAVCAINRLGGVAVLTNPDTHDGALRRALEAGGASYVVADPERAGRARALFDKTVLALGGGQDRAIAETDVIDMEAIDPAAADLPAWYEPDQGRARDLAFLFVSTGRTGEPRVARVTNHRFAFSALGAAAACTLTPSDTVYCCLPLHHAAGSMVATGSALVGGARLALADRFSPEAFWTEVRRYGATVAYYAGEMCRQLVLAAPRRGETNHPLRLLAGSGMRADLWERLRARFGAIGILEFYASTETNAVMANASGEKPGAVGRPLPGSKELVLAAYDPDLGDFIRSGDGRLVVAAADRTGMLLARLDGESLERVPPARVLRGVFESDDAYYVTGDLVRRDAEGDHFYEERVRDVIPTRLGAVLPRKVEDRLYRMPGAAQVVVYGARAGAEAGDSDREPRRVEAAVSFSPGFELDPAHVEEALAGLPERALPAIIRSMVDIPTTEGFRPLRDPVRRAAEAGELGALPALVRGKRGYERRPDLEIAQPQA